MGKITYPKVTKLVKAHGANEFHVFITKHQFMKLEPWIRGTVRFREDSANPKWAFTNIYAKDELEAVMRFRKLWAGLPKKEQTND